MSNMYTYGMADCAEYSNTFTVYICGERLRVTIDCMKPNYVGANKLDDVSANTQELNNNNNILLSNQITRAQDRDT